MPFEEIAPLVIFCALVAASLGAMVLHVRLPARWQDDDSNSAIRLTANFLTVMTSLLLGLMLNAARTGFEQVRHDIQATATQVVVLDHTLARYGAGAEGARRQLALFARVIPSLAGTPTPSGIEAELDRLQPVDARHEAVVQTARDQLQRLTELQLNLAEQADGSVPRPLIVMLGLWLTAIFASLGYRAPPNVMVAGILVGAAALVTSAVWMLMDMGYPYSGPISASWQPVLRAVSLLGK